MTKFFFKMCPKCEGPMYFNADQDLNCITCGKIVYLHIRRGNDTRTGERRDNALEEGGTNVDGNSHENKRKVWDRSTPDNSAEMSRQMGVFRRSFLGD
tara:strand:+ start:915 stop:1208 length:294 start_codon:yes stop_codon:yes gene_type:complete